MTVDINPLPHNKIIVLPKLEAFEGNCFNNTKHVVLHLYFT